MLCLGRKIQGDRDDGEYYCINGGIMWNVRFVSVYMQAGIRDHCQTANACTATTDESKKDGKDGEYYCINGGTISGASGSCQCTCAGFEGDHCEDRKICTNTTDTTKTTGADGKFYCINGGTVGGFAESCTCTGVTRAMKAITARRQDVHCILGCVQDDRERRHFLLHQWRHRRRLSWIVHVHRM